MREIPKYVTIRVEVESNMYGVKLSGDFKFHRRTLQDLEDVSRELSSVNSGLPFASGAHGSLINAIYELKKVVDDSPEWWEPVLDSLDDRVIMHVYGRYLDWLKSPFRDENKAEESRPSKEE